jgi:hypothetical protein
MANKIQLRRDTVSNWQSTNPILSQGEIGIDLTNNKIKIGNGSLPWNSLPYFDDKETVFTNVNSSIIPSTDNAYDLGSPTKQWRHIYVSEGSLYIGNIKLSNEGGRLVVTEVSNPGMETEAPVGGGEAAYQLPMASSTVIGGIRVGNNLTIDQDGVLSAEDGNYTLPIASDTVLGGIRVGDNLTIDETGTVSAVVPDVNNFITADDIPAIPADVSDLTDTQGLLSGGGNADTGDITFEETTISAPDGANIIINGKVEGVTTARLEINPEGAVAKLESFTSDQADFYSGDGLWATANWTVSPFGRGQLVFTGAEQLYAFLDSSTNAWNFGSNERFSWNDGELIEWQGYSYGGGTLTVDLGPELLPPTDPTEVTTLRLEWDNVSRIAVDSGDFNELQISGRGMNVEIDSTSDVNIEANDDLRLTGRDVVSIRNRATDEPVTIVTNYDGSSKTWQFEANGELRLPSNGIIRETVVTGNPTIELEPADAEAESQKLVIKGGGPVFSNTENGITVEVYDRLNYSQGDTVNMAVNTSLEQGTTLYWWIDNYSPDTKFTPDNGELTLDEFGNAYFNFVVNDDTVVFRVYVADTLYNAYINNLGAVSVDINTGAVDNSLHLHLTTGDLTLTSIFLGTDDHNVRTKPNGNIEVTAYDYDLDSTKTWKFGTNATLTFPMPANDDIPSIEFPIPDFENGSAGIVLSPSGLVVRILDSGWTFSPLLTGEGTVPAKITFPDGTQQTTAWAGGRVVSAPSFSTGAEGDRAGDIAFSSDYFYYCIADYTDGLSNIWKRVAWSAETW